MYIYVYIGEGNGNPLQYSCLVNPRDGGAWWAAIYGVTQIRTQLKRLSSSSRDGILSNMPYKVSSGMITVMFTSEKSTRKGCIGWY